MKLKARKKSHKLANKDAKEPGKIHMTKTGAMQKRHKATTERSKNDYVTI